MTATHESALTAVSSALPDAVERALNAYLELSRANPSRESREHAQFHTACKNALAHLEALLKLSQALRPAPSGTEPATATRADETGDSTPARPTEAPGQPPEVLRHLLRDARAEVSRSRPDGCGTPDSRSS